ncbi:unnamed protein product [Amoebophrya sp. A25]|nr:unnamed protein product [Amoebophrya sp. A25]|eukprot:GSA25T00023782001.1
MQLDEAKDRLADAESRLGGELDKKIAEAVAKAEEELEKKLTMNFTTMLTRERDKVNQLTAQLSEAEQQIAAHLANIERLQNANTGLEETIRTLEEQLSIEKEALATLRVKSRAASESGMEKDVAIAQLKAQMADFELRANHAESRCAQAEVDVARLQAERDAAAEELEAYKQAPPEVESPEALAYLELMAMLEEEGRKAREELGIPESEKEEEPASPEDSPKVPVPVDDLQAKAQAEVDEKKRQALAKAKSRLEDNSHMREKIVTEEVTVQVTEIKEKEKKQMEQHFEKAIRASEEAISALNEQIEEQASMMREMETKMDVLQEEVIKAREKKKRGKKPTVPEMSPVFERLWDDVRERWDRRKRLLESGRHATAEKLRALTLYSQAASSSIRGGGSRAEILNEAKKAAAKYMTRLRESGGTVPVLLSSAMIDKVIAVKKQAPTSRILLELHTGPGEGFFNNSPTRRNMPRPASSPVLGVGFREQQGGSSSSTAKYAGWATQDNVSFLEQGTLDEDTSIWGVGGTAGGLTQTSTSVVFDEPEEILGAQKNKGRASLVIGGVQVVAPRGTGTGAPGGGRVLGQLETTQTTEGPPPLQKHRNLSPPAQTRLHHAEIYWADRRNKREDVVREVLHIASPAPPPDRSPATSSNRNRSRSEEGSRGGSRSPPSADEEDLRGYTTRHRGRHRQGPTIVDQLQELRQIIEDEAATSSGININDPSSEVGQEKRMTSGAEREEHRRQLLELEEMHRKMLMQQDGRQRPATSGGTSIKKTIEQHDEPFLDKFQIKAEESRPSKSSKRPTTGGGLAGSNPAINILRNPLSQQARPLSVASTARRKDHISPRAKVLKWRTVDTGANMLHLETLTPGSRASKHAALSNRPTSSASAGGVIQGGARKKPGGGVVAVPTSGGSGTAATRMSSPGRGDINLQPLMIGAPPNPGQNLFYNDQGSPSRKVGLAFKSAKEQSLAGPGGRGGPANIKMLKPTELLMDENVVLGTSATTLQQSSSFLFQPEESFVTLVSEQEASLIKDRDKHKSQEHQSRERNSPSKDGKAGSQLTLTKEEEDLQLTLSGGGGSNMRSIEEEQQQVRSTSSARNVPPEQLQQGASPSRAHSASRMSRNHAQHQQSQQRSRTSRSIDYDDLHGMPDLSLSRAGMEMSIENHLVQEPSMATGGAAGGSSIEVTFVAEDADANFNLGLPQGHHYAGESRAGPRERTSTSNSSSKAVDSRGGNLQSQSLQHLSSHQVHGESLASKSITSSTSLLNTVNVDPENDIVDPEDQQMWRTWKTENEAGARKRRKHQ